MSNAAVINATNSSGLTVGSPITIETGGDVVLKAFGSGSGDWSATLAFAPVVDGVAGSPTTLTIGANAPSAKTSVTKSDATQWVGWIMSHSGTWEASGIVEGWTGDEALAGDLGDFGAIADLPTKAVKSNARATISGVQYTWRGAAGWKSIKAKRAIVAPYNQAFEQGVVNAAYGFTERFKAPSDATGFDVVWFSAASAGTLAKAAWGRVAGLTGSYSQQSPVLLQINGSDISNATIPAGSNFLPSSALISDFVNAKICAGDVIEIRSNTSGTGRSYNQSSRGSDSYLYGGSDLYATENLGTVGGTGDCITGNPAITCNAGTGVTDVGSGCFIRWYSQSGKISALECGDSITKGEAGFAGEIGKGDISPLHLAASINPSISPIVLGHGGNSSANFHNSAILLIPIFKPSTVVIPAWSPNDSVGNMDASINRALRVCSVAIENGAVPLLKTPNPWSYTGSNLTVWQAGVARVRAICASNPAIGMIDITAALEDPANPGAMKPAYFGTATDGQELHPNPAGKWAEAQAYAAALSGLA